MTSRTYAYCRVSSEDLNAKNQIDAIRKYGYDIPDHRVFSETISGSSMAMQRQVFNKLIEYRMEPGDRLVVLKLDRLGRDAMDVQNTVADLIKRDFLVTCLDLPVSDLSSSEGKMMLGIFAAFAEFERNRIIERTHEGIARARREGKHIGRPFGSGYREMIQTYEDEGMSTSRIANILGCSTKTVRRHLRRSQPKL